MEFNTKGSLLRVPMNTRFVIAIHTLLQLTLAENPPVRSEKIAASVDSNPAFIRQILGKLREEELVVARRGPNGGYSLAREPEKISLLDAYQALAIDQIIQFPEYDPHPNCPIGNNLRPTLYDALIPAEDAVIDAFEVTTIDQLAEEVQTREVNHSLDTIASSDSVGE